MHCIIHGSDMTMMMSQYKCRPIPKSQRVIRGFQYKFPNGTVKDKQLPIILENTLDNVYNLGGKLVTAFPDSATVSEF